MTPPAAVPPPLRSTPSVRGYTVLCLASLMGMVLALMLNDRDLLGVLLLAAAAAFGVVTCWRIGPPLVVLGLVALEVYHHLTQPWYLRSTIREQASFMDIVLCASVLAYAVGHYRLLALTHTAFPVDFRRSPAPVRSRDDRRPPPPHNGRLRRSAHLPGPWEMPMLALVAGVWAVAVFVFWFLISNLKAPLDMSRGLWRGLLLIFLVGATTAVLAAATTYLSWIKAAPAEHLLYLQDQAWRETRGEQNRINRWLQWARLRGQRRKEKT